MLFFIQYFVTFSTIQNIPHVTFSNTHNFIGLALCFFGGLKIIYINIFYTMQLLLVIILEI